MLQRWTRSADTRASEGRGFTLVELLVVIAIIALLTAILLPVLQGVQRKAAETACRANLHELALGLRNYKSDYKAFPLGCVGAAQSGLLDDQGLAPGAAGYHTFSTASARKSRLGALYPTYVQSQRAFLCPEEAGTSYLALRSNPNTPVQLNGRSDEDALTVTGDANYTSSSYDDYYNFFGYNADGSLVTVQPAFDRRSKMLFNRYAPDTTVVTYCREHEDPDAGAASANLLLRADGGTARVPRGSYQWAQQPEAGN